MTTTLPLFHFVSRRHASWYALLLLPVLPFLKTLFQADFELFPRGVPLFGGLTDPTQLILLFALGFVLAIVLPDRIARCSHAVRKEVELLRPAWIGSVLFVQATLLPQVDNSGLDLLLFAVTCLILGAIPFGAEFQQRTLSSLLSQPRTRSDWWQVKMGTLGVALGLHVVLYLLSRPALGHSTSLLFAVTLLIVTAVAGICTPWWTLVVRGLLPGFVFALAAPLLTFLAIVIVLDITGLTDHLRIGTLTGDEVAMYFLLCGALPFYAAYGWIDGRRRWRNLEASDHPTGESGAISLPLWGANSLRTAARVSVTRHLLAKEFRVQTVTLLMGLAALVMGLLSLVPIDLPKTYETMIPGGCMMLAAATILLAGATTVAEERRLGTLSSELLLPISRSFQWSIKALVAAMLATVAGVLLIARAPIVAIGWGITTPATGALLLVVLFVSALLTSSTAPNTLRALLQAVAVSFLAIILGGTLVSQVVNQESAWELPQRWPGILADFPTWQARAAQTNPRLLMQQQEWAYLWSGRWYALLIPALVGVPTLLGLAFARHNFLRPDGRPHRLKLQIGVCSLLVLSVFALHRGIGSSLRARIDSLEDLAMVQAYISTENKLSQAERMLFERFGNQSFSHHITVTGPKGIRVFTPLPLSPADRWRLMEAPDLIPADLREALKRDAEKDPRKYGPPTPAPEHPKAAAQPTFQMSPQLMRRYGLIPQTAPATTEPKPGPVPAPVPSQP